MRARRLEDSVGTTGRTSNASVAASNPINPAVAAKAQASSAAMCNSFCCGAGGPKVSGYTNTSRTANAIQTATNWSHRLMGTIIMGAIHKIKAIRELPPPLFSSLQ